MKNVGCNSTNININLKEVNLKENSKNGFIQGLKFSPKHNELLAKVYNCSLEIVNIESNESNIFTDHFSPINTITWDETGSYIATGGNDGLTNVYDFESGKILRTFMQDELKSAVTCLDFNYCSNLLLIGVYNKQIIVNDLRMKKPSYRILAHSEPLTSINFNDTSTQFMSTSYDGFIRIWDLFNGLCLKTLSMEQAPAIGKSIYLPDEKTILVSSINNEICLFDIFSEETISKFKGHTNNHYILDFDLITKNLLEKTGNISNDLNINEKSLQMYLSEEIMLISGSEDGALHLWDFYNSNTHFKYDFGLINNKSIINNVSINKDSSLLAFSLYYESENPNNENENENCEVKIFNIL